MGAFSSGLVLLLKARPFIWVSTQLEDSALRSIDPGKAGCQLDPASPHACFHFKACFSVDNRTEEELDMRIKFSIVAKPKKAVSRVWLRLVEEDGEDSRSSRVDHLLHI